MNPQNAYLGVYARQALFAFFDRGYVKLVYGDVDEGIHLCHHERIDDIHLTGSQHTFNQIVFGTTNPEAVRLFDRLFVDRLHRHRCRS